MRLPARVQYASPDPNAGFCWRRSIPAIGHRRLRVPCPVCLSSAGLKPEKGRVGPRPYDLRHAFAVHRWSRWYRQGVDLHGRLPWLSAYMGHVDIIGTETYLNTTPKLLNTGRQPIAPPVQEHHRRGSQRMSRSSSESLLRLTI